MNRFRNPRQASKEATEQEREHSHSIVRAGIWLYFILIILEGPLRKWILPGLANQLILIRDPVLILIYASAVSAGVFRTNWITMLLGIVGATSVALAVFTGHGDLRVALYGFDVNFLHLPLIFVMGEVMEVKDVLKIGRWILLLALPTALLMAIQFRSDPNSPWNYGPGASPGTQMQAALGKIRPPGLFTFVTGAAMFLTLASAIVLFGFLRRRTFHPIFLYLASFSLIISTVVSSSRLVIGGIGVVFLTIGIIGLYDRKVINGVLGMLLPLGVAFFIAASLDVFQEGKIAFEARLEVAGDKSRTVVQTASSWSERVFGGFTAGFTAAPGAELFGWGVGFGTNVGSRLLTGKTTFMTDEREWGRVVLELGPILALPYLIARIAIFVGLWKRATASAKNRNPLPLLLLGCCGLGILNGQFGVAATLSFTVFQAGMCLAACNGSLDGLGAPQEPSLVAPIAKRKRGRSPHAIGPASEQASQPQ